MNKSLWFALSVVLLGLCVFGASQLYSTGDASSASSDGAKKTTSKGNPLLTMKVETVKLAAISKIMELTGSVTPTRTARMAAPVEGPVEACEVRNCMVREGDRVTKGQILLRIGRNQAAQAQLTAARQALKEQEMDLQRVEQLVQNGAIAGSQLDAARSKFENARAQLSKALESSEDYSVTAPWDGIVFKVNVAEGDYVAPRAALIEIFDPASMVVQFAVAEAQSTEVRNGLPVQVQLDAHPGKSFQGKISRIYPQLDNRMRTRTVEATLAGPVELIPGMFARVQVVLVQIPDAVTVPAEAVLATAKGDRVVFVLQDGQARVRKVQTGIEADGRVQILAGVAPGDQVIVAGNENLKDGTQVQSHGGQKP